MINLTLDFEALNRQIGGIVLLRKYDATPLMLAWQSILTEDNRRGILAGEDKDGGTMVPVRYRPVGKARRVTSAQKLGVKGRARGKFGGFGPLAGGLHNNLSSAEYRTLGGPPLAPRGAYSRVITNFVTDHEKLPSGSWQVTYWWQDVVSTKGNPFLRYHFEGAGRLPRRDLRGLRPAGAAKATRALEAWSADMLRSIYDPRAPYLVLP